MNLIELNRALGQLRLGRVTYRETRKLLDDLAEATIDGTRRECMESFVSAPLLIIDDLGMRKLPMTAAEDLLEIVMRRYERASTLLTSNRPVDDWGKLLGDSAAVTAMLDRLLHHGHVLKFVLDGYSRSILHWDLRESMKEAEIEMILERAKEKYPEAKPSIISDNGPQFIARDFKEFIRISGMTHVRTSPFYPQSNGKLERWHKSLKTECIRPLTPLTVEDARRLIQSYVDRYNTVRLHSAIGYVTPQDMLAGRQADIHAARDRKLEDARRQRQLRRQQAMPSLFARSRSAATMTAPVAFGKRAAARIKCRVAGAIHTVKFKEAPEPQLVGKSFITRHLGE